MSRKPRPRCPLDSEFGRTTDPVRMYMREMRSVELLPARADRNRQADRGRPEAHDHGHLRLPDDGGADLDLATKIERTIQDRRPGRRRMNFNRRSTRSRTSTTKSRRGETRATPARSPRKISAARVAALTRFARSGSSCADTRRCRRTGTRRPIKQAAEEGANGRCRSLLARQVENNETACATSGQHPPDRAQDPGPRHQQGRHAASGFHPEFPESETSLR